MDDRLLGGSLLILFGLLFFSYRLGIATYSLLTDLLILLLLLAGAVFLLLYFREKEGKRT